MQRGWRSISVRMMAGTGLSLVLVLACVGVWRYFTTLEERRRELEDDAALTARVVLRSLEAVEPGRTPVHADSLARNLVDLPEIHNILVVSVNGRVSFSHHPDEVGRQFDPASNPSCSECHADPRAVVTGGREYLSRSGARLFHRGFAVRNQETCQRCHDSQFRNLGMLLLSFEMEPFYADMARFRESLGWAALAALLVAFTAVGGLFSWLVRRPLRRLEQDIRAVEQGHTPIGAAIPGSGEIDQVQRAFQAMAGRLAQAREALEERVRRGSERIESLSGELDLLYSNLMHLEHLSAMGTLSAQVAHEIRTPLNAMGLTLQLVERSLARQPQADPRLVSLAADLGHEVQRIVAILNQFMSRVRRPSGDEREEPIAAVLESTAFLMSAEARRGGVQLEVQVADQVRDTLVRADHTRQILTNLLSNAVKATPPGGTVRLLAEERGPRGLAIAVHDSGPGVPPEMRERIFEPFFTTRDDGTGLGLAIVRHVVSEYGGSLEVGQSSLGGAEFTFFLGDCHPRMAPGPASEESGG